MKHHRAFVSEPTVMAAVAVAWLAVAILCSSAVQAQTFTTAFPDGSRQVIAHEEPHGLPDYWAWNPSDQVTYYRELFPLEMRRYGSTDPARVNRAQRLKDAGLTSLHILRYDGDGCDFTADFDEIDAAGGGVTVAPCMNVNSENELVRQLTQYAASAAGRTGAQRIRDGGVDKLVISTYWTPSVSMQGWQNARSRLSSAGVNLFIIADYAPWGLEHVGRTDWDQWAPLFESYYFFGSPSDAQFTVAAQRMNQIAKSYAGGMMPGTARETAETAAFFDAQATAFFRGNWEKHLAANVRWNLINTWNDRAEYTEIRPTSTWNWTRADLNRWYSVKMRDAARPFSVAKLYVTTPQHLHLGEFAPAEALVINWSSSPVTASIQMQDYRGNLTGSPVTATVAGNSVGAAQLVVNRTSVPPGRFMRARATTGTTSVTSAPILFYEGTQAGDLKQLYYSIPADKALPGTVGISLSGDPGRGSVSARVTPPAGATVRFVDVLQNTRQTGIIIGSQPSYAISAPLTYLCSDVTWNCTGVTSFGPLGFYVGRVIDEQERVGYSDPVYVDQGGVTAGKATQCRSSPNPHLGDGGVCYTVEGRRIDPRNARLSSANGNRGSSSTDGLYIMSRNGSSRLHYRKGRD